MKKLDKITDKLVKEKAKLEDSVVNYYEYNQGLNKIVKQLKRQILEMEDRSTLAEIKLQNHEMMNLF